MFTGYWPTLLEDVPDMAFKFAAYESMRGLHRRLTNGRSANVQASACRIHRIAQNKTAESGLCGSFRVC